MKNQISMITSNPIGAVVGGVAFYYGAKKMANISNMYALLAIGAVGLYVGAMLQTKLMPKGTPTATTTK